jgi:hypothetical protein
MGREEFAKRRLSHFPHTPHPTRTQNLWVMDRILGEYNLLKSPRIGSFRERGLSLNSLTELYWKFYDPCLNCYHI